MNIMTIIQGFAATRHEVFVEREVHHRDERPVGTGWRCVETDLSGYSVWERRKVIEVPR